MITPAAVFVIGDVHVRGEQPAFQAFLSALLKLPPARLIILGDLCDYWLETASCVSRYADAFASLRELADHGWQLDLLIGNREMTAGRSLATATRCRLHWPSVDLTIGGRRIRVVHGDRLCNDPGYHGLFALVHGFWTQVFGAIMATLLPDFSQDLIGGGVRGNSQKRNHDAPLPYLNRHPAHLIDPKRLLGSLGSNPAEVLIAGHIHYAWQHRFRYRELDRELYVVGDWSQDSGYVVSINEAGDITHYQCRWPKDKPAQFELVATLH